MHLLTGIWSADETDTTETIPTTLMPLLQEIAAPDHFPTFRKLCSVVVVGFFSFYFSWLHSSGSLSAGSYITGE